MIISDKDREKFIHWLETTAITCNGMAEQIEKMPGDLMIEMAKREKTKAAACLLIATDLKNTESMSIGNNEK